MSDQPTLATRWFERLQNNPLVAAIVVAGLCIGGVASFFKDLPESWTSAAEELWPFTDRRPSNGWAYVGYLSNSESQTWATGPFIDLVSKSGAADREYPFRNGDVVTPRKDLPQVIVDYRDKKNDNVLTAPPHIENTINPPADYTGLKFRPGEKYLVDDVYVPRGFAHDAVMWLRLTRAD